MSTIMLPSTPAATVLAAVDLKNESSSLAASLIILKGQESPESPSTTTITPLKATDETLSTANCDDSLTASTSANMTQVRLYEAPPPVEAVNVDRRSVRQRLRDQEAKINALLNKPPPPTTTAFDSTAAPLEDSSEEVSLKLIQTLEADLKKALDEKEELQYALTSLQETVEEEKAQEEKLESVADGQGEAAVVEAISIDNDAMAERISQLEMRLKRKTNETYLLQDRWESTIRRMVQCEVDLETHDLHFTDYAAQQYQLGDEAIQELRGLTQKDQPPASRQLGKKAKQMLSTLLKDLENLGDRYKRSQILQEQQVVDLRIAQIEWQRRAEHLEVICEQHEIDIGEDTTTTKKKLKQLQQQSTGLQDRADLQDQVKASQQQSEAATLECDVLKKEVERLRETVAKLQNTTREQEEAIYKAQQQAAAEREAAAAAVAAAAAAQTATKLKKKKGWFMKQKKAPPTQLPPPPAPLQLPARVDVTAALAPMDGESKRFDMLHERMQAQVNAIKCLQQDCQRVAKQKTHLQDTVTELREQQEREKAIKENDVLHHMQSQMDQLEAKRAQEQEQAQATIDELRAQLAAFEMKNAGDDVYFV